MSEEVVVKDDVIEEEGKDYIDQINKLKESTVSKEKYEKLKAENKKLLESLVNGDQITEEIVEKPSIKELRKQLFNPDHELNNLEYCERALNLRNAILEDSGEDIFVAKNATNVSKESYDAAERVASVFEQCIEYAQGDPEAFTGELMRRTNDVSHLFSRTRK